MRKRGAMLLRMLLRMARGTPWAELAVPFFLWSVAGVLLIELVATELLSGEQPLAELALVRGFEFAWLVLTALRCRCLGLLGLGLPDRRALRVFAISAGLALAAAGLIGLLAIWLAPGSLSQWRIRLMPAAWLAGPAGLVVMAGLAPVVEEWFFRGVIYRLFRQAFGMAPAVVLSALAFASVHGSLLSPQLAGGLLFAVAYEASRCLWVPVLLHAGANAAVWWLAHAGWFRP